MKKFFVILLSLLLIIFCVLSVNAQKQNEPVNYLEGLAWQEYLGVTLHQASGLSVTAVGFEKSYNTPALNIAPALKLIFAQHPDIIEARLKLSANIQVAFQDRTESTTTAHFKIRAFTSTVKDAEQWNKDYIKSIGGGSPFFEAVGSHAMRKISDNFTFTTERETYTTEFSVSRNVALCEFTPNWYFCIDGLDVTRPIKCIYFKDMRLEIISTTKSTAATPTPKPTPTAALPPRVTPSRTLAPYSTPVGEGSVKPTATLKPTSDPITDEQIRNEFKSQPLLKDIKNILSLSVKGAIIIIIIAGFFAVITNLFKRKK